jgi:hypothetical protein
VAGLDEALARQSGRYAAARELSAAGREAATRALCKRCVKAPVWHGATASPDTIPCPEPCSVLVSLCREAALWERATPEATGVDPSVAFADFEQPGNEVRESYLAMRREEKDG